MLKSPRYLSTLPHSCPKGLAFSDTLTTSLIPWFPAWFCMKDAFLKKTIIIQDLPTVSPLYLAKKMSPALDLGFKWPPWTLSSCSPCRACSTPSRPPGAKEFLAQQCCSCFQVLCGPLPMPVHLQYAHPWAWGAAVCGGMLPELGQWGEGDHLCMWEAPCCTGCSWWVGREDRASPELGG